MQQVEQFYNYSVVRKFVIMSIVWGIFGMGLGVLLAGQLIWPALNLGFDWSHFGRLRPLHTNIVIFAFGGCVLMGSSFFVVQRTCQTRLISDKLADLVVLGVAIGDCISDYNIASRHYFGQRIC